MRRGLSPHCVLNEVHCIDELTGEVLVELQEEHVVNTLDHELPHHFFVLANRELAATLQVDWVLREACLEVRIL